MCKWRTPTVARALYLRTPVGLHLQSRSIRFIAQESRHVSASWSRLVKCLCPVANRKCHISYNPSKTPPSPAVVDPGPAFKRPPGRGRTKATAATGPGPGPITPKIIPLTRTCVHGSLETDQTRPSKRQRRPNWARSTEKCWP